ncbi:MAG: DUF1275 domain-containing protein [Lachnospira sp.]|nr:DUF1275 domain-containing protein [Lachnospira sp.]
MKIHSNKKELQLHSLMCCVGGFLGAYAILCRLENFGSAQTNNLIQVCLCFLGRDFFDFMLRVAGMVLYMAAIAIYAILHKKTGINLQKYAISIDIAGLILLSLLPSDMNPVAGILPIFFMMATQWSVFHGSGEYISSTIFSTNNLRQFTLAASEYLMEKDTAKLKRAKYFANSLLCYHVGVIYAFFACRELGVQASLLCLPIVLLAFGMCSIKTQIQSA